MINPCIIEVKGKKSEDSPLPGQKAPRTGKREERKEKKNESS